jgi:hypothetical protein
MALVGWSLSVTISHYLSLLALFSFMHECHIQMKETSSTDVILLIIAPPAIMGAIVSRGRAVELTN